MNFHYKLADNFHNNRIKINQFYVEDGDWRIHEPDDNEDQEIPENDPSLTAVIEKSELLFVPDLPYEEILQIVLFLSEKLDQNPNFTKYISCDNDTFFGIQLIIDKKEPDSLPQAVSLLKLLLFNLPVSQNCIDVDLVLTISQCFDFSIPFFIVADLIDILAQMASYKEDELFKQMKKCEIISRICDILSFINPYQHPSREREPLNELPFIEMGNDLEIDTIVFPLLVFIFYYFNWEGNSESIIADELMEHLLGILHIQLEERALCCCLNTLMYCTKKKNYGLLQKALKSTKLPVIKTVLKIALNSESNTQLYAIQTILNISQNDDEKILLDEKYINDIFSLIELDTIDENLREKLMLIIESIAYDACSTKMIKSYEIIEVFRLHFLEEMYDDASFLIRSHIASIFANLLEKRSFKEVILNEINILDIFLPLIQTSNSNFTYAVCDLLQRLIENEQDDEFRYQICNSIKEENILDDFTEPDSIDTDTYMTIVLLQQTVNNVLSEFDE